MPVSMVSSDLCSMGCVQGAVDQTLAEIKYGRNCRLCLLRQNLLTCTERQDDVCTRGLDDRTCFTGPIDNDDGIKATAPERVVGSDGLAESGEITFLYRPAYAE